MKTSSGRGAAQLLLASLIVSNPALCLAHPPHNESMPSLVKLSRVQFNGLARCSPEQILAAAGLRTGQVLRDVEVKDLSNRLIETGLFAKVSNRYLITRLDMDITFEVVEAVWDMPVLFDNFVWFSERDLIRAVAARVPTFDGTSPENWAALGRIKASLQELLEAKKLPGRVAGRLSFDPMAGGRKYVVRVEGVDLPVCHVRFPGAAEAHRPALSERVKAVVGEPYSRDHIRRFTLLTLLPWYHEEGYLRARFGEPETSRDRAADCARGVVVTVPVREGAIHLWEKARWIGNSLLTPGDLDGSMGMRPGEAATAVRINAGLEAVKEAYKDKGCLEVSVTAAPVLEGEVARVIYEIRIQEGPRYRMGSLHLVGLPEPLAREARRRWQLLEGGPFDASYPDRFVKEVLIDPRFMGSGDSARSSLTLDREHGVVDVSIHVIPGGG